VLFSHEKFESKGKHVTLSEEAHLKHLEASCSVSEVILTFLMGVCSKQGSVRLQQVGGSTSCRDHIMLGTRCGLDGLRVSERM
jgi:hypothetical protein